MSRSSGEGHRFRPSHGVRAQVEPLAALAAVLAVSLGLGIYTGALHAAIPVAEDRQHAPTALDAVADRVGDDTGVLPPEGLPAATAVAPDGRLLNATLTADGETSRHRMVSDDLPTTFETLVTWFAQSVGGDTSPERALGLLLTKSDASVELPPDLIRKAAVEHGLSADDSIGDLLRAAKEEGSITME